MTSDRPLPFVVNLHEAAARLEQVSSVSLPDGGELHVALPLAYARQPRERFPLLVVPDARTLFGSAVEMTRLMTQTRELRPCIVAGLDDALASAADARAFCARLEQLVLPRLRQQYRISEIVLFGPLADEAATTHAILANVPGVDHYIQGGRDADGSLPALVRGVRARLSSGRRYGDEMATMARPLVAGTLGLLAPLIGRLRRKPPDVPENPQLLRSRLMQRDFEIFVSLPASAARSPQRRYPVLLALDANIEFSTVAETAARMAAANEIAEVAVVGIGVPRVLGPVEFGFRRFEEFCPPADGYQWDDELARVFRSLFALRGQDARTRVGQAAQFLGFITGELLPLLSRTLPIDVSQAGLLGHSAGGTFVAYALCQPGAPFTHYACISPGVGMAGSWLLRRRAGDKRVAAGAQSVFLSIGSEERDNRFNQMAGIPDTPALAQSLRDARQLKVVERCFEGETHSSTYPLAVVHALRVAYAGAARATARQAGAA
ncbi:MAG TPA: alpha/beta hydrolase-fold protein [Nevskiaceae bacterium]|nr:alpha/beta hydrolase-fold protein [Nevskiaceae bacterium]